MKALIIRSNHGNHHGFNRHWDILKKFNSVKEAKDEFKVITEYNDGLTLFYTYVITALDYNHDIFNGGHMGYASKEIVEFFK
jgi:hypothetical protein